MNRTKIRFILLGFVSFGFAILIVNILNKFKLTELDWILSLSGLALLIIGLFYLFRSKKPLVFFVSGLVLSLVGYFIIFVLSKSYSDLPEFYTYLAAIILPILTIFSGIFTLLAAIYIFKDIFKRGSK